MHIELSDMVWLDARSTQGNHVWVGHKEVARGDVFGNWKRFTYYVNGNKQYIYCRTQKVFLNLFVHWCSWASVSNSRKDLPEVKYNYTLEDIEGVDITTEAIIMDNPDSKPFRVKSWIWSQQGEYIQ